MVVDRGMSTPLDVALGLLLVGAAIGVVAGINPGAQSTPSADGSVVLGSTVTVTYETDDGRASVTGTMGGLLADAVVASRPPATDRERRFARAARRTVDERLDRLGIPVETIGTCKGAPADAARLRAGGPAPPGAPVRAVVHEFPSHQDENASATDECTPIIVVRRWSP